MAVWEGVLSSLLELSQVAQNTTSSMISLVRATGVAAARDGKRYKRYKRCWCKEFPTGVKILVENVIKGGVKKNSNVFDNSWKPKLSVSVTVSHCLLVFHTVSWCFTLFLGVSHCF